MVIYLNHSAAMARAVPRKSAWSERDQMVALTEFSVLDIEACVERNADLGTVRTGKPCFLDWGEKYVDYPSEDLMLSIP